jgi:hypothetical protein
MAYDATKDVTLKTWQTEEGLQASINQYNEGEKKFQVGPRMFVKKNGEVSYGKVGRLTYDEIVWLRNVIDEAVSMLAETNVEES